MSNGWWIDHQLEHPTLTSLEEEVQRNRSAYSRLQADLLQFAQTSVL